MKLVNPSEALRPPGAWTMLFAVLLLPLPSAGQPVVPVGEEFRVNVHTTSLQYRSKVAFEDDGSFVIVWASYVEPGFYQAYNINIQGRSFTADGSAVGGEFLINSLTTGRQEDPAIDPLGDGGGFLVVWASDPEVDFRQEIVGRRLAADGLPQGEEFAIHPFPSGAPEDPDLFLDDEGHFVVAWPNLAADRNGDFAVVWEVAGLDGALSEDILGRRFAADGTPRGAPFRVNEWTTGRQRLPAVAMTDEGDFVVVWQSGEPNDPGPDGSAGSVRGRLFAADGTPRSGEFQVHVATPHHQSQPAVDVDASGNFVVVWTSEQARLRDRRIFGRRFGADGVPASGEFQVSPLQNAYGPDVAIGPEGQFVVTWHLHTGRFPGQTDFDVRARRFALGCSPGPTVLCLRDRRFQVEVSWRDPADRSGAGRTVPATNADSGLFYFFSPRNWELLVKVLDGCSINRHFWVFAAATTTVEYTLRVTDLASGEVREYFHPEGTPAPAITDTTAFATCDAIGSGSLSRDG